MAAFTNFVATGLTGLQAAISASVGALPAARVHVGQADPERRLHGPQVAAKAYWPHLELLPGRTRFLRQSEEVVDETLPSHVAAQVGSVEGSVELRLGSLHKAQRDDLEASILHAFNQREGAPGSIIATISGIKLNGVAVTSTALAAFHLESSSWEEEKVWEKKRHASLIAHMALPVLVLRSAADTIDQLVIAFTQNLTAPAATVSTTDFQIDENGTLTEL